MYKVLLLCDDLVRQTFILDQIRALETAGCQIKTLVRFPLHDEGSDQNIGHGFAEPLQVGISEYFWYFYLKLIGAVSKDYARFLSAYADWSFSGRLMGTARALRWLQIYRKVRGWGPDIVHVHFAWNLPHIIPLACCLDIPIVCTVHGSDIYLRDDWPQHLRNPAVKRIVCVSDSMKAFIDGRCPDLAEKTARVFNPINKAFLQGVAPRPDGMRIIMIAGFRTLKNHAWLLRSLRMLKDRQIDFECVLLGDAVPWEPDVFGEVRSMTQRLDIAKSITFRGWLTPQDVVQEIDQSTVFALTSTSEGLPTVVVEALARQRMPVVTDVPGMRDATGGGQYGFLIPLNDVEGLTDALLKAHEETIGQTQRVRLGREFVSRNFHPDVHLIELEKIYETVLLE